MPWEPPKTVVSFSGVSSESEEDEEHKTIRVYKENFPIIVEALVSLKYYIVNYIVKEVVRLERGGLATPLGGCASFGHSCFGGHGKRAELPPDGPNPINHLLNLDPIDYQALQLFRQLCTLQPEQFLRMAPIFRRLTESYTAEAEEPLPRK